MQATEDWILAVDIGTTAMKGGLIDPKGNLQAYKRIVYKNITHQGYQSWDSGVWIQCLADIVAGLGQNNRIRAVTVSGQGPSLVPLDSNGQPLHHALLWLDQRSIPLEGTSSFFLPKINWFRENERALFDQTRWFVSCPEYLDFFLTGEVHTVTPSPEFKPYIWHEADWKLYGLDSTILPPFVTTGDLLGKITPKASRIVGLPAGIPVVAGGSDFLLSLLGAGAVRPGRVCDRAGTSEGINYCHTQPLTDPHLRTLPHVIQGLYNISGILSSTGRLFEWYRKISGQMERSYKDILEDLGALPLERSRPYFFPTFESSGNFEFAQGGFLELSPEHSREDLGRAVIESIGFGIRKILGRFERLGCQATELRVTGGQARNHHWNQIKADITGCKVLVPQIEDAELLGGAITAYTALGEYENLTQASDALVRIQTVYEPRVPRFEVYTQLYNEYVHFARDLFSKQSNS